MLSWEEKLASGLVDSVWLQIGSDLEALKAGLEFVRDAAGDIQIYGSVFVPSRQLLSRTPCAVKTLPRCFTVFAQA